MTINVEDKPTPRYVVCPTIAGVPTPEIECDGDLTTATDQPPLYWRVTINPGDDPTGAAALLNGQPEVMVVLCGDTLSIGPTDVAITSVHAVAVGSAALPADYTGGAYIISKAETDAADALAQRAKWEFAESYDVREVILTASAVFSTYYSRLICQGVSYA